MNKIKLAIIYGGKSAEHEVSKMSARNVIDAVSREKYDVTEVFISPEGNWSINNEPIEPLTKLKDFDVVFPVMHGQYGEDGTMQGLLKLADVPFVGPDVLGSAVCMDKDIMKRICRDADIAVAPWITIRKGDVVGMEKIEDDFGYPLFIKPANMGSSVGVHKADNRDELAAAITDAFFYDKKVVVEAAINGKEIEVAVTGNENPVASLPGYIQPTGHDFYTYESKYEGDDGYTLEIPAPFSNEILEKIQEIAVQVYKLCECEVMSRVDMFVTDEGEIIVNEINTIPGPNAFAKLWQASGIEYSDLIDKLVQLAIERHQRDFSLKITK